MTRRSRQIPKVVLTQRVSSSSPGRHQRDLVDVVQATAWSHGLRRRSDLTDAQIDVNYCQRNKDGDPPKLAQKWARGEVTPTKRYVDRLEEAVPGSSELMNWMLWPLLRQKWIPESAIQEMLWSVVHPRGDAGKNFYHFPGDPEVPSGFPEIRDSIDVDGLLRRNDHYGFMVILALVRYAEIANIPTFHRYWSLQLFRAFPGFARHPDLYPARHELLRLTTGIVVRRIDVLSEYTIDSKMLLEHIESRNPTVPDYGFIVWVSRALSRPVDHDVFISVSNDLYWDIKGDQGILPAIFPSHFPRHAAQTG